MKRTSLFATLCLGAVVGAGAVAIAAKDKEGGAPQQMKLPPGWTTQDMAAMMSAGMPGPEHKLLAKGVGTWQGKTTMWMYPGGDAMPGENTSVVTSIMDGKFTKCEVTGNMPGMGPFSGLGLYGYDNVSKKYVSTWIDNMGTGMMTGTGEMSSDGKTLTWSYTMNCPIAKKAVPVREVDTDLTPTTKRLEMYGNDPKTGKEFKMMQIELTKK